MQAGKGNCKENEGRIREIIKKMKAGKRNNEENEGNGRFVFTKRPFVTKSLLFDGPRPPNSKYLVRNGRFVYTKRPFVTKSLLFGCLGPVTYALNPPSLPQKNGSRPHGRGGPLETILKLYESKKNKQITNLNITKAYKQSISSESKTPMGQGPADIAHKFFRLGPPTLVRVFGSLGVGRMIPHARPI